MIKAIIFDYGGVLSAEASLQSFGAYYAPKFGKNPEEFSKLIIENWRLARVSDISSKLFWKNLAEFIGIAPDVLRKDFLAFFGFREEVFELVKELKKKKYKLGLLSNQIEDWLEEVIENRKFNKTFDVIVTSYKSRIAKPDVSIFEEIVEKLKVKPAECIYIDDLKRNIPPAKQLGMKTILFTDLKQLKKELAAFSVKID
ncbi:MAG: HAD-IA family hydrolase [Nanoarchaeota archaeon]|nr:HAD-IA family hydrolase [Nanoarchaeota archaeon]